MMILVVLLMAVLNPADAVWPSEPVVAELDFAVLEESAPQYETREEALLAYQTARNDAISSGDEEALWTIIANHMHPVGEWDAELIKCFSEALGVDFEKYKPTFFELDTISATDGWTPVDGPHLGAGTAPESTYGIVRMVGILPQQRHVAFTDDMHLVMFYEGAEPEQSSVCF